ncbi:MAG: hypothetical protein ACR2PQ_04005 [Myxococcota bacterium]
MSFSNHRTTLFAGLGLAAAILAFAAISASAEPTRRMPLNVVEDGGSCRVDDSGAPEAPRAPALTAAQLDAIKARMLAVARAEGTEGVIPLNGRGYNYRRANDPTRELLLIQREVEAAR